MFLFLLFVNFFLSLTTCSSASSSFSYLDDSNLRNLEDDNKPEPGDYEFNCSKTNDTPAGIYKCPDNSTHYSCNGFDSEKNVRTNCKCNKQFANIKGNKTACTYERKRQLTAFLLELFVGFGAGHFYRANYLEASLKLVAFLFGIYIICLFPLTAKCVADCCDCDCLVVLISLFWFLISAGLAFWFIFDLVWFGKNKYLDKNGFCLMEWGKSLVNSCDETKN